ncbi:LysR family transcriptional regulator [Paracoccus sediminis]|uniref:LysR family transcriptional regulator n=1 Tax=Paracoccus sediminis TaxID=1214787 RepID=A0A238VUX4_9RHOB|nr:LysR family transcriptional regulator [Paracoccus sediminis]TBN51275.1 LysR family transcriptional regulator [Paracoccus sediminis]SNR37623.1 transcriptional regulator, LysR family [Paracoccus sediminis]
MSIDSWDDLRIALAVARTGTVSGAAEALGVHHATVIRRIDSLESRLGTRLFQRHPRGYALTESGQAMLKVAGDADERFAQLAAQIAGGSDRIEGELVVTSLPDLADVVMPRLIDLMRRHPSLRINYATDVRLFRLDAGEAHVAIRAGSQPTEPDYVVRPMGRVRHPIYAAHAYVAAHGPVADIAGHRFALPGPQARNAPLMVWLRDRIRPDQVVLTANDDAAREAAIRAGLAIGPLSPSRAEGLAEVMSLPEWDSRLWLVTHVDLHRMPKVQAALAALRDG